MNSFLETSGQLQFPRRLSATARAMDPAAPPRERIAHSRLDTATQNRRVADSQPVPWWLWWNILSLDAPVVAVTWQVFLGRQVGAAPSVAESAVLALTVWLIYIADHLLDAAARVPPSVLRQRHWFCLRHRRLLIFLMSMAGVAAISTSLAGIPVKELKLGMAVAGVVLVYLCAVHFLGIFSANSVIKELAVGFTFSAGVLLTAWSDSNGGLTSCALPFVFLGLLCALNCLTIESCEATHPAQRAGTISVARRGDRLNCFALILALSALAALIFGGRQEVFAPVFAAVSAAAAALLLLHYLKGCFSSAALRVLADVVLLVPPAVALALTAK